jgi:SsrA-binding protein
MSKSNKKKKVGGNTIAVNKKARHDYFIEEEFEAGIALQGWEVKSLRDNRLQLAESYVLVKNAEAFLFGAHISPMNTASTHINPDPTRSRKLLLHRAELSKLIGAVERKGYTLVPLSMYWAHGLAKLKIGLGKGKKAFDKRAVEKEKDWNREKQRLLRSRL